MGSRGSVCGEGAGQVALCDSGMFAAMVCSVSIINSIDNAGSC